MNDNDSDKIFENYVAGGIVTQMNEDEAVATPSASIGIQGTIDALSKLGHDMQTNPSLYGGVIESLKAMKVTAFAGLNVKAVGILLATFSLKLDDEKEVYDRLATIWAKQVPENELAAVNKSDDGTGQLSPAHSTELNPPHNIRGPVINAPEL